MARRCKGSVNRLIMFRKKNLVGSFFQNTGSGCVKTMGNAYDVGGALAGLKPTSGYTGPATGCGDADGLSVTVNFNQDVTWTSALHPGVSITATGGKAFTVSGPAGSTAKQIEYIGTWSADPVAGDVIQYEYDADAVGADYVDGDGAPMADAWPLTLTNCEDAGSVPAGAILDPFNQAPISDPADGSYILDPAL